MEADKAQSRLRVEIALSTLRVGTKEEAGRAACAGAEGKASC